MNEKYASMNASLSKEESEFSLRERSIQARIESEAQEYLRLKTVYESENSAWVTLQTNLVDREQHLSDYVKLNVGGKDDLMCTVAQLTCVRDSKLEMFFQDMYKFNQLSGTMHKDRYYIDRDPFYFQRMLQFISREGNIEPLPEAYKEKLF